MVAADLSTQEIKTRIQWLRGEQVLLDDDLGRYFQIETKYLTRAVRRNSGRFPEDFAFELTQKEYDSLRCQLGTLKSERGKFKKYLPLAFTEQGVAMLSSVLRTPKAIEVSIALVRAFVQMRRNQGQQNKQSETFRSIAFHLASPGSGSPLFEISPARGVVLPKPSKPATINETKREAIEQIKRTVSDYFEVKLSDLKTSKRTGRIPKARQVAMYLVRDRLGLAYREIGDSFGGKDHSTVLHACQRLTAARAADPEAQRIIAELAHLLP